MRFFILSIGSLVLLSACDQMVSLGSAPGVGSNPELQDASAQNGSAENSAGNGKQDDGDPGKQPDPTPPPLVAGLVRVLLGQTKLVPDRAIPTAMKFCASSKASPITKLMNGAIGFAFSGLYQNPFDLRHIGGWTRITKERDYFTFNLADGDELNLHYGMVVYPTFCNYPSPEGASYWENGQYCTPHSYYEGNVTFVQGGAAQVEVFDPNEDGVDDLSLRIEGI